jgi:hypothetical protein
MRAGRQIGPTEHPLALVFDNQDPQRVFCKISIASSRSKIPASVDPIG